MALPQDIEWNIIKFMRHPVAELFQQATAVIRTSVSFILSNTLLITLAMLVLNYGVIVIFGVLTVGAPVQTVGMNAMIGMIAD